MKTASTVQCVDFPCLDTRRTSYLLPDVDVNPVNISILLISEAAPENPADYYYAGKNAPFAQTTLLAFQDAGAKVTSIEDIRLFGSCRDSVHGCHGFHGFTRKKALKIRVFPCPSV